MMKQLKETDNRGDIQLYQQMLHFKAEASKHLKRLEQMEATYHAKKINELLEQKDLLIKQNKKLEKMCRLLKEDKHTLKQELSSKKRRIQELTETMWKLEAGKLKNADEDKKYIYDHREEIVANLATDINSESFASHEEKGKIEATNHQIKSGEEPLVTEKDTRKRAAQQKIFKSFHSEVKK
ncbi:hypothetical protein MM221_01710 [Salipaludibacillus sp. LMS25]|jgi:hypothetical protein|uniref:hypothetical protein n=1 Tax=Salipaludibacillus sp. LMS25 TaxID=2924031 RepID=UPI0020D11E3F|nr:hypothetical protein [Salipaludibacillus sp. LMS25]UTR15337.1 hypothetical protein MM221_01710 [Salipaludibacillus sp. LMS25]